ncbi:MAG: alpha/beta hydrolase [Pseudomonadota bacterium]
MFHRTVAVLLTVVAILAAGWLVLRRADIPYDTLETMYSVPDTQFLTLNSGLKVHYTDTGPRDGMAMVLVHGFTASLHTWQDWKADLEKDFRVITLDLPGHGLTRSEAPEEARIERFAAVVDEVADKLGVADFTLAGNSMGGNTAWYYALTYPERLDSLILLNASGWPATPEEQESSPLVFKLLSNAIARAVLKDLDMNRLVKAGLEDSYTDQSFVTEALVNRYSSLSRAPGHRETILAIAASRNDRPTASNALLSAINVPTLVLWGEDDNLVSVSHAQAFGEAIPGAKVIVYEGVGHLPQEEATAQSLLDVRDFMMDVEWGAVEEETIEPAGDPRLVEDRLLNGSR